jgi:hypothetical protein
MDAHETIINLRYALMMLFFCFFFFRLRFYNGLLYFLAALCIHTHRRFTIYGLSFGAGHESLNLSLC